MVVHEPRADPVRDNTKLGLAVDGPLYRLKKSQQDSRLTKVAVKTILSRGPGAVKVVMQFQLLPYADTPAPGWLFQTPGDVVDPDGPPQTPPGTTKLLAVGEGVGGEVREEVVVGVKEEDVVEVTVFEGVHDGLEPGLRV